MDCLIADCLRCHHLILICGVRLVKKGPFGIDGVSISICDWSRPTDYRRRLLIHNRIIFDYLCLGSFFNNWLKFLRSFDRVLTFYFELFLMSFINDYFLFWWAALLLQLNYLLFKLLELGFQRLLSVLGLGFLLL